MFFSLNSVKIDIFWEKTKFLLKCDKIESAYHIKGKTNTNSIVGEENWEIQYNLKSFVRI